jgi:hypothetical protein
MFEMLSVQDLESELVGLAGHLAAGTCRMLHLLAEFDTRNGWAEPGLRSCAHWLNWRIGMSLRTAREHLRVAHALRRLPGTTAAFAAGRVSFSKVRALTRIASADNEQALLNVALHGTTSQLEALVRDARAGADPRPAAARRGLHHSRAADGSLLIRLRLPADQGEQLLALLEAHLAAHPTPDPAETGPGEPTPAEPADREGGSAEPPQHTDPPAARRLDALLDLLQGNHPTPQAKLVVHLPVDALDPDGGPNLRPAWIDGGPAVSVSTAERLTCTSAVQALLVDRRGNPLYLGRTRRVATTAQLLALRVRDGHRCRFPGCTTTRNLEAHHIRWWRHHGPTDLDNLVLICRRHHVLIHDHGYRITHDGSTLAFHRPDLTRIPEAGPPTSGTVDDLMARHTHLRIDDRTITPRWGGERLDPDPILRWLVPELRASSKAA